MPKLEYKIIDNNTSSKLQCQLQKGEEEINIYNGYSVKLIMKMMSFLKNIKLNQSRIKAVNKEERIREGA